MINRTGQVWEDDDSSLIYLVLWSAQGVPMKLVFNHRVLFLHSNVGEFNTGELGFEFERIGKPWEGTNRRRLV